MNVSEFEPVFTISIVARHVSLHPQTIRTYEREYKKVQQWINSPDGDLGAVGAYFCFTKGEWGNGLPLLAVGATGDLQALAEKDLAAPKEGAARREVGDGWWALASSERNEWKKGRILVRARYWYEEALPGTEGLAKVRLENRLEEVEKALGPGATVNLLRMIDLSKHQVAGTWKAEGGALTSPGSEVGCARIPAIVISSSAMFPTNIFPNARTLLSPNR